MIKDLSNKIRIISYSDDNHGTDIYINGKYTANMDDRSDAVAYIIQTAQKLPASEIVTADIYLLDINESDEIIEEIEDIFNSCQDLTEAQELAILNQEYEKLI